MRPYLYLFLFFLSSIACTSCRKGQSAGPSNPNIIMGCEIVKTQVTKTYFNSYQSPFSYTNTYEYDSLGRVTQIWDGQNNDTDHYEYNGHDGWGNQNSYWHYSAGGNLLSSSDPEGSYQYTYDGNGYLQLVVFTDTMHYGSSHSYTETYYWGNNNLSYSVRLSSSQPVPVTTTYSYYADLPNQVLIPISTLTGHISANLPKQVVITMNGSVVSSDSYTYIFDASGKVAQYTDQNLGQSTSVCTLSYSCN
jgi:YD repeat-containing protein